MKVLHCNPAAEEYQLWLPYTWGRFREFCDYRSEYDLSSIEWLDPIYLGWFDVSLLIPDIDFKNVDVLLLSFYVWNEERQWEIAKIARSQNPDILILGGGIMNSAEIILPKIKKKVDKMAFTIPRGRCKIFSSKLGNYAPLLGATFHPNLED